MSRPLLDAFEPLKTKLPFTSLIEMPTPVEKFNTDAINLPELEGLWVKRDDSTNPVYGGNKVRKLEFILSDAQAKEQIVTLGAIGTNHGVATSIFCRAHGLKCRIFLFDQPLTSTVIHNLKLMIVNGAKLEYKGSILSAGLHYYLGQAVPGRNYFLPAGGSNVIGCIGYVNAAFELKQQIDSGALPEPDRIICPVGSSGTLAGLTLGCQLAGLQCHVQGVRVAPSHLGILPICTTSTITRLLQKTHQYLRNASDAVPRLQPVAIDLDDTYCGEGYGHTTAEGDTAMELFGRRGIALESTYTAKTAAAVLAHCRKNPEETILYWHTFNSAVLPAELSTNAIENLPRELRSIVQR